MNRLAPMQRVVLLLLLVCVLDSGSLGAATQGDAPPATQGAVSESLWYDADQGKVIPVEVNPVADDSINRDSRWLPKPKKIAKPEKAPAATPAATTGGGGWFGSGLSIGNVLGWLLLALVLVAAVAALAYLLSKAEIDLGGGGSRAVRSLDQSPDQQTIERMKHLPAELRRTDVNLRTEAERLMNAGQFDQAIILLFGHQLLLLDRVGMLRLNRGKTNRKYVRETRSVDVTSAGRLQQTVDSFERSYFGRHEITADEFAGLWRSNSELEQSIVPNATPTRTPQPQATGAGVAV